jgi:uncharacterized lipoprotein NlpE involved in copper resistance
MKKGVLCILLAVAFIVLTCSPQKNDTATQSPEQPQTKTETTQNNYNKILNGDLSDFAGIWVNNKDEKRELRPNGYFGDDVNGSFRVRENGSYSWSVGGSSHGIGVVLYPVGIPVMGLNRVYNDPDRDFIESILPTDTTKVRICLERGDSPFIENVYYRETESLTDHAADSSRNSVDWEGMYTGVIPAASSSGIEVTMTLNDNLTFELQYKYLDKSEEIFTQSGTFKWNNTGNTIILDITNYPPYYMVGEKMLIQLDMEGNRITGNLAENYILEKTNK